MSITPHGGGDLVDLRAAQQERAGLREKAASLRQVPLSAREETDLELLANGGFSPLRGFMTESECKGVTADMHLPGGVPWTIPITLCAERELADGLKEGEEVALIGSSGDPLALLEVRDRYTVERREEARAIFKTDDEAHPGVATLYAEREVRVGGRLTVIELPKPEFPGYHLDPQGTRAVFNERGWKTIVAFQTRNPIHRAHEYLTKCALEMTDGLLIHPIVGETKSDDIPAGVRIRCYEALLEGYYPADRVLLAVLPASMRYAGPREAIFHAIMRRNYGCTHFIVGRDHAGVGDYYGTYEAQEIFDEFDPEEIEITPLKFEHSFFCKKAGGMASSKTTNSDRSDRVFLSGTKVRELLLAGEDLPPEFTRPEVSKILMEDARRR